MSVMSEVYKQKNKYSSGAASFRLFLTFLSTIFLIIYNWDEVVFELFHKYDVYTTLTFDELIDQGYDEDDTLLNSLNLHTDLSLYIKEAGYKIESKSLTAIKDRESRPLQASSIIDFYNQEYSYRIEIIHKNGLADKKELLVIWNNHLSFLDDNIIDTILDKADIDIEYQNVKNIFINEYKKDWREYNKELGDILIRMDSINNKFICFIGNEKKSNKIDMSIEKFMLKNS